MSDWPVTHGCGRTESAGHDTANSRGTTLTGHATANTEQTTWTQIIASTAFDADSIWLDVHPEVLASVPITQYLIQVGIGAGGSEQILIPDFHIHRAADTDGTSGGFHSWMPIPIPAGTRIAARVHYANASSPIVRLHMNLISGGFHSGEGGGRVSTFQADVSDGGGLLTQPTTLNTRAWVEFSSSLPHDLKWLYLNFGLRANSSGAAINFLISLARGASGQEDGNIIIEHMHVCQNAGSDEILPSFLGPIPCQLKAGDRLAVGIQASSNDGTDRQIDCTIMGIS